MYDEAFYFQRSQMATFQWEKLPQLRRMFPNLARHGQKAGTHLGVQTRLAARRPWYPDSRGSCKRGSDVTALSPGPPPRIPCAPRWPDEHLPCPPHPEPRSHAAGTAVLLQEGWRARGEERKERTPLGKETDYDPFVSVFFFFSISCFRFSVSS